MKIIRKQCAEGAREARGVVVIIDVFRAFSCEPLLFHLGVKRIILEADPERAIGLKERFPEYILAGEVDEVPIRGGDLGNSPSQILSLGEAYFKGKTVIHRTTAGVTGVAAAVDRAEEIILGSFLTAGATAKYLRARGSERVTLVGMGSRAQRPAPEDEACADYLEHLLIGKPYDHMLALKRIIDDHEAQKFLTGTRDYLPREDPLFCLQRDVFDFLLVAGREEGRIVSIPRHPKAPGL